MSRNAIRNAIRNAKKRRHSKKFSTPLSLEKVNWERVERIFAEDRKLIIKKLREETERRPYVPELLKLLAGGAVFGLSLMIPVLPMALAPFIVDSRKYEQSLFGRTMKRLKKQKLVEIVEEKGQTLVRITEAGRVRALRYKLDEIQIKKPKVWDKKWRIVIFDIPEKYKRMREIFRDHLKTMGFYMLQKSVWVHPYPCFNEIEFLRQVYNVGINVTYIVAEKIESPDDLKSHFSM